MARLARGQPATRAEARARAARQRHLPSRARASSSSGADPYAALRERSGPARRSSSRASTAKNVTVRGDRRHARRRRRAQRSGAGRAAAAGGAPIWRRSLTRPPFEQLRAIYSRPGRNLELRQPLLLGDARVRLDPHRRLDAADPPGAGRVAAARRWSTALAALGVAVLVAALLAQLLLRPIHVIRSGLTRLGQGRVRRHARSADRTTSSASSARSSTPSAQQLSADRIAAGRAGGEPGVGGRAPRGRRGDVNPSGELLFAQSGDAARCCRRRARRRRRCATCVAADHPLRRLVEQTLASRQSRGPMSATFGDADGGEPASGC